MDQVAKIRDQVDIVGLIGEYLTLKKAGRNFKSPCPFHTEKSPSFVVSPERQIWHCFGCGKGGDCYSFVMEYEHLEFPEALRLLAKRVGIELVQNNFDSTTSAKKEALYALNKQAAEFYHYILMEHKAGQRAREYLAGRMVSEKVLKSFLIGYAPSGTSLSKYLLSKKKVERPLLSESGLTTQTMKDFFWDRIMFPLVDHRDNIVGFSGRILKEDAKAPKYINTRDTLVYHKGEMFFGLNMTKEAIRKEKQAILVEGEFDVLSCFQNGVANTVAVKGTALTEKQVSLLARYASKITVCFDGDSAGQEAIKRSLPLIEKKNLSISIVIVPGGKDPDESIRVDPTAFKLAVKNDSGIYDYLLASSFKQYDKTSLEGKKNISEILLPTLALIQNEIIKEHYLRKLSSELETSYESLLKEMDKVKRGEKLEETTLPKRDLNPLEAREEYLLSLILQAEVPKAALEKAVEILSDAMEKERAYQKLIHHMLDYFATVTDFSSQSFGQFIPGELHNAYDTSLLFPLPHFLNQEHYMKEVVKVSVQLREMYLKDKMKKLTTQIKSLEAQEVDDGNEVLREEFSRIANLLKRKL